MVGAITQKEKWDRAVAEENRIAKLVGGIKTKDLDVFDVIKNDIVIEVKTIVAGKNDKITVHPPSLKRKKKFIRKNKVRAFTVAIDARTKKTKFFIREGVGSFRLSSMTPVNLSDISNMF